MTLSPKILVNPGALEQVLVNLLVNACQAMDQRGFLDPSQGV